MYQCGLLSDMRLEDSQGNGRAKRFMVSAEQFMPQGGGDTTSVLWAGLVSQKTIIISLISQLYQFPNYIAPREPSGVPGQVDTKTFCRKFSPPVKLARFTQTLPPTDPVPTYPFFPRPGHKTSVQHEDIPPLSRYQITPSTKTTPPSLLLHHYHPGPGPYPFTTGKSEHGGPMSTAERGVTYWLPCTTGLLAP